jgi:hypothetical protein
LRCKLFKILGQKRLDLISFYSNKMATIGRHFIFTDRA